MALITDISPEPMTPDAALSLVGLDDPVDTETSTTTAIISHNAATGTLGDVMQIEAGDPAYLTARGGDRTLYAIVRTAEPEAQAKVSALLVIDFVHVTARKTVTAIGRGSDHDVSLFPEFQ